MLGVSELAEVVEKIGLRLEAQLREERRVLEEILTELRGRPVKPPASATLSAKSGTGPGRTQKPGAPSPEQSQQE